MKKGECGIQRSAKDPMSAPGDDNKICYAPDFGFPIYHLKVAPYSVCKVPPHPTTNWAHHIPGHAPRALPNPV